MEEKGYRIETSTFVLPSLAEFPNQLKKTCWKGLLE